MLSMRAGILSWMTALRRLLRRATWLILPNFVDVHAGRRRRRYWLFDVMDDEKLPTLIYVTFESSRA